MMVVNQTDKISSSLRRSLNTEFHTGNNITREILNQVQDDGLVQDDGVVQDDGGYSE